MTSSTDYVTRAEFQLGIAHLETRIAELETRMIERIEGAKTDFEKTVHAQTRQMFNLLLPVYGGLILGLLIFIASKVI